MVLNANYSYFSGIRKTIKGKNDFNDLHIYCFDCCLECEIGWHMTRRKQSKLKMASISAGVGITLLSKW